MQYEFMPYCPIEVHVDKKDGKLSVCCSTLAISGLSSGTGLFTHSLESGIVERVLASFEGGDPGFA